MCVCIYLGFLRMKDCNNLPGRVIFPCPPWPALPVDGNRSMLRASCELPDRALEQLVQNVSSDLEGIIFSSSEFIKKNKNYNF